MRSGISADLVLIDQEFRKVWLPFFCKAGRGTADLGAFEAEVRGLAARFASGLLASASGRAPF